MMIAITPQALQPWDTCRDMWREKSISVNAERERERKIERSMSIYGEQERCILVHGERYLY